MPYIKAETRDRVDHHIENILDVLSDLPTVQVRGALNYIISEIVAGALNEVGSQWKYNSIADAIGTFECAKLEFYRRVAARKEDRAILENGDIFHYK